MSKYLSEIIAGYPIDIYDIDAFIKNILAYIFTGKKRKYLVCANPHSLEIARSDCKFKQALLSADFITPDGIGVVIASKINGGLIKDRVTGSDIFDKLNYTLNMEKGYRYFFLGSTEETLRRIKNRLSHEFPNICVSGYFSPPFKSDFTFEENQIIIERVNQAHAHVLWVGMTAPKQEKWIYKNRDQLDVNFIGAVGAVFDYYAGTKKRSGPWFRKHGIEWLPRLIREPRRMWFRCFVTFPLFIFRNLLHRLL